MRTFIISCLLFLSVQSLMAQSSFTQNMLAMNKLLVDFSPEQSANFTMSEQTGLVEQNFNELVQRYKLNEIGLVAVSKKAPGFIVSLYCKDSGKCINLIRENATNVNLLNTSYYFNIDAAANAFAEHAQSLIQHFKSEGDSCKLILFVAENGKTNRLKIDPAKLVAPAPTQQEPTEKSQPVAKKKVVEEEEEKDEADEKPMSKAQEAREKKKEAEEKNNASNEESADGDDTRKERAAKDFCGQLMQVIDAGKQQQFKTIEGKATNADKKINESSLKLKGAKRSYLTTYKTKRAFIAEFRVSSELELMNIEFDKLQTQVENCVPGNWEDIDHADDAEYADMQEQVRDIEYKSTQDKSSPSMRIVMLFDGKKYILFLRIN